MLANCSEQIIYAYNSALEAGLLLRSIKPKQLFVKERLARENNAIQYDPSELVYFMGVKIL